MLFSLFQIAPTGMGWLALAALIAGVAGLSVWIGYALRQDGYENQLVQQSEDHKAVIDQMIRTSNLIQQVVDNTKDGLIVSDLRGRLIWANRAYCTLMGRSLEEMQGRNYMTFAIPKDERPSPEEIEKFRFDPETQAPLVVARNRRPDGTLFWNQISVNFVDMPGREPTVVLGCRDISEQINDAEELATTRQSLEHQANHDSLTGLANRAAFLRVTTAHLEQASAENRSIGMLRVDLDKFKQVNDTYGHAAGDAVLIHVADALRKRLRQSDLVARVGGDEFVVVCPDISILSDLDALATQLGISTEQPLQWKDSTLSVSASFGGAISDPSMQSPEELLHLSDVALYEAKRTGRSRAAMFDADMQRQHTREAERLSELADTLDADGLTFYFQPTLLLHDGTISGFEALVRWDHPTEGILCPDTILPLAAELGRTGDIDLAAMRAGVQMKLAVREAGLPDVRIGLNASAEGLQHPDYVNDLITAANTHQFALNTFAVEVLETVVLDGCQTSQKSTDAITYLHDLGVQTFLDDFGVGHAGLAHLTSLDISGIKIDRSLASYVLEDRNSFHIVRALIDLCNNIGLRLIAEGVESQAVASRLQEMGVQVIQGYWVSRPMPADKAVDWLQNTAPDYKVLLRRYRGEAPASPSMIPRRRFH